MNDASAREGLRHRLLSVLAAVPARRTLIAYSGGLDSHVLLHLLAGAMPLTAVHIHHGLQAAADDWVEHCRRVCGSLGIPLEVRRVDGRAEAGESPEAAARRARYRALESMLQPGDRLLAGHHADDQAETVLLALLRGSGPAGLAGMPFRSSLGAGWLLRPLLDEPRTLIESYGRHHGLQWVDDPSNADTSFDRNLLRLRVLPLLRRRWPALARTLGRSARLCAESHALLLELADEDLGRLSGPHARTLALDGLKALDPARRRNVLRRWLSTRGLHAPGSAKLDRIERDFLFTAPDRQPRIAIEGLQLMRYRGALHLAPLMAEVADRDFEVAWKWDDPLRLPDGSELTLVPRVGAGIDRHRLADSKLGVRYRAGGERFHPEGRVHRWTLKNWLQAEGVPPWERNRLPLLWVGDELVAVADLAVAAGWTAGAGADGLVPKWNRSPCTEPASNGTATPG